MLTQPDYEINSKKRPICTLFFKENKGYAQDDKNKKFPYDCRVMKYIHYLHTVNWLCICTKSLTKLSCTDNSSGDR